MYSSYLDSLHMPSFQRHRAMHSLYFEGVVMIDHQVD